MFLWHKSIHKTSEFKFKSKMDSRYSANKRKDYKNSKTNLNLKQTHGVNYKANLYA